MPRKKTVPQPVKASTSVTDTLASRELVHGDFDSKATYIQQSKEYARSCPGYNHLTYAQCEALDNIHQKIGRILFGDSNCGDHWHDIAGYASLGEENAKKQR